MKRFKIRRKRFLFAGLILLLVIWFSNSMEFRMDDHEVVTYFGNETAPQISYFAFGQRQVRYLMQDNGQETTVIFVHGAPGSSSAFIDYFFNQKLKNAVNLVSIDRPGYGYSGYGDAISSLTVQAQLIAELTASLELQRVILVGHSLGAPIIAKAAIDHPSKFQGLVLVAGSVDPSLEPEEWFRPMLTNGLARMILPASLYVTNEEIYYLKDQLGQMKTQWQEIAIPIITIHGDSDVLVPLANTAFLEKQITGENLEIWIASEVNHFIPWNRPDLIVDGVLKLNEKL